MYKREEQERNDRVSGPSSVSLRSFESDESSEHAEHSSLTFFYSFFYCRSSFCISFNKQDFGGKKTRKRRRVVIALGPVCMCNEEGFEFLRWTLQDDSGLEDSTLTLFFCALSNSSSACFTRSKKSWARSAAALSNTGKLRKPILPNYRRSDGELLA